MVREKEMMVTMIQAVNEVKGAFEYTPDETRHGKRDSWYIMKQSRIEETAKISVLRFCIRYVEKTFSHC